MPPDQPHATDDLARQAYDFATRHPGHPLAENLRSKARPLSSLPASPAGSLELRVLLDKALSMLAEASPSLGPPKGGSGA